MNYLVTGKNGQLAQAFLKRLESCSAVCSAPDESSLDITDERSVRDAVASLRPDVILNCAAYNLVDQAEQDKDAAFRVNARGPEILARAAREHGALIVHFGSDYVFDGAKENGLYQEGDPTNPLNEYGKSKLAGEEAVLNACERSLVLRLSWVFGAGKQNFIAKLLQWANANEYLKIACDEFSAPTYTEHVVDATLKAIEQGLTGRYHLTNTGHCSRYEWARFILRRLGIEKFIRPVSMDSFNLPAKRPKFSAMSNKALSERLDISIPSWEEAVGKFLAKS